MFKLFKSKRAEREALIKQKAARLLGNRKPDEVEAFKRTHEILARGK